MRKIIGGVFQSLDGIMQAPGGPDEDKTGGFGLGGWVQPFWDEKINTVMEPLFSGNFDLLLGRKTYEIFSAYWPYIPESDPISSAFAKADKYVLTRGDTPLEWKTSHRVKNVEELKKIKAGNGSSLLIQGSSTIYPTLLAADLIDEILILTFPITLGKGKRLFGNGTPPIGMKLINTEVSPSGVIMARYQPNGKVPTGTFETQAPSEAELKRRERWAREG
ncbi:dihydrofolate reductase family protein [Bdellovibrio reynosensis]|uniref:Dihydrofolate reductase family protein n=1 Tax=Bdellovibrio reynosensis TaxID=2835041 RepID=A0ABY4CEJ1_9BACT|nr:dihydrofolate reductase family protein [Bdellovibrio reynosensis]UOF00625.1 dihydrofolate reductase family protein [Bdellovibrio reynosensis]